VVLIGFRLAGAKFTEKEQKYRLLRGLVFTLCVILSLAGTGLAGLPLLVFLLYGVLRGAQIIMRGQGGKRILIGAVVCVFTVFAVCDYFVSLAVFSPVPMNEARAVSTLRTLAKAEENFGAISGQKTGKPGHYGTLEELRNAKLLDESFAASGAQLGYLYSVAPSAGGQHYFILAVPHVYAEGNVLPSFVPGASLRWVMDRKNGRGVGRKCFAMDDSGVVRAADVGPVHAVSREVAMRWNPL